jgi:hypothetical protein
VRRWIHTFSWCSVSVAASATPIKLSLDGWEITGYV